MAEPEVEVSLQINGQAQVIRGAGDMPLLWALRDPAGLMGTKFGCGAGLCGACTVLLEGQPVRSCQLPLDSLSGVSVVTIEGLNGPAADVIRTAWAEFDAVQCGYCQSGQILAAFALLRDVPQPTEADIDGAMDGNICRCGSYQRIRLAILDAAARLREA